MTTTYTYINLSSGTVERGLSLAAAGRRRCDDSEHFYEVWAEKDWQDNTISDALDPSAADIDGMYRLMSRRDGAAAAEKTVALVWASTRAAAEQEIYEEVAKAEWRDLRGEIMRDADFNKMIDEMKRDGDTAALECYGIFTDDE